MIYFFSYILYGVVSYHSEHYVSHVRRRESKWETHNDLLTKISRFSSETHKKINPQLLVYIKN